MSTQQTAKTHFIEGSKGTFAYRRFGASTGTPLLALIHYRGTMDKWDPLFINSLAASRPLILVDYLGIGKSTGRVATSFADSADDIVEFLSLVKVTDLDVLGFSVGGVVAQLLALNQPGSLEIQHLIICGSTASVGPDMPSSTNDSSSAHVENLKWEDFNTLLFSHDDLGKQATLAYWKRLGERTKETRGEDVTDWVSQGFVDGGAAMRAQQQAYGAILTPELSQGREGTYDRLSELKMPVLVTQGSDDYLFPTMNSCQLQQKVPDGQLIVYPHSSHGFLYQHAERVAQDIVAFVGR
ncbi:hypothetical protein B0A48_16933 [Cryoendolithus antarcticus]|uniref:AB hydrolase-1 domain-containing protein n=1 Tax=Cryoendolithus antarcticus TaxID=1507870 RepID=A0A1V8SD14_9PEZI|nr:hypothetical protein B0A48_16933 [Cryoendolithus antarcticus]